MRIRSIVLLPALHWIRRQHRHHCPNHVAIHIGNDGHRIACFGFRWDDQDWIVGNIDLDGKQPDPAPERDSYDRG
jgi:hypothetical protein